MLDYSWMTRTRMREYKNKNRSKEANANEDDDPSHAFAMATNKQNLVWQKQLTTAVMTPPFWWSMARWQRIKSSLTKASHDSSHDSTIMMINCTMATKGSNVKDNIVNHSKTSRHNVAAVYGVVVFDGPFRRVLLHTNNSQHFIQPTHPK